MRSVIFVLVGVVALGACRRDQPPRSKDAAERMATATADQKQAELWKQAAARPDRELLQIRPAERPVESRRRAAPATQTQRPPGTTPTLPQQQPNAVRILATPSIPEARYSGPATIKAIEGNRMELDLGAGRTLSLLARVRSGSLTAKPGETVQVEWRAREEDPRDRSEILALRTSTGDGIVTVLEGGTKPVSVRVNLYRMTATQTGTPERGSMPVQVTVGDERQVLQQGQIAEFKSANLAVGVVASVAVTGEDVNREEGNPYAIRLLAWPLR
jgi:hypothetical protein